MTVRWLPPIAFVLVAPSCGNPDFDPPELRPKHEVDQDGALHAVRFDIPFLCGVKGDERQGVPCDTTRPARDLLSCDAAGCHGGYEFVESGPGSVRDLRGSEGPSCYTCHGRKWRTVTNSPARAKRGESDDD